MQIMTRDKEIKMLPEEQAKMMGKKDTKCLLKIKLIYFRNDFIKILMEKFKCNIVASQILIFRE